MAIVFLFGGGDAGGLLADENGFHRIPPFDAGLRNELQAVAKLISAAAGDVSNPKRDRLIFMVTELSSGAVASVEREVGEIDSDHGLVYTDEGGGFICGSTGEPPIPLPWPPADLLAVEQLTQLGLVGAEAVEVLRSAAKRGPDIVSLLRDPEQEGQRLGVNVSESAATQTRQFRLGDPSQIDDLVDREIVEFLDKSVVGNEALIDRWVSEPLAVADQLGTQLGGEAARRIVTANATTLMLDRKGQVINPDGVAGVAAMVIVMFTQEKQEVVATYDRVSDKRTTRLRKSLTTQERAVAGLVVDGYTNRETAEALAVSVKTVEYHLGNIYSKLGVTSRTRLAVAMRHDLGKSSGRIPSHLPFEVPDR